MTEPTRRGPGASHPDAARSQLETYQDEDDRRVLYDPRHPLAWIATDPETVIHIPEADSKETQR
jgi:hypothetical protein